jgi:hypothetical protein
VRTQVKNRLVMTKDLVSARKEASSADRYAWVWVTPLDDGTFRVSTVEIPKQIVDDDVCFYEPDIQRTRVATLTDVAEVDEVVRGLGVDPETLDAPWHNNFPL